MQKGIWLMLVVWAAIAKLANGEQSAQPGPGHLRCPGLTTKPSKVVKPAYPNEALRLGIRGTVIVELLVDKQGLPQDIQAIKGDPILVNSVLSAVKQWRWRPYRINHRAVALDLTLAVNFEPASHAASVF